MNAIKDPSMCQYCEEQEGQDARFGAEVDARQIAESATYHQQSEYFEEEHHLLIEYPFFLTRQ